MKIIIQMTETEFYDIMDNKKFTNRKDFANYVSNTYNGGEECDAVEIFNERYGDRYCVYIKGDENLGK